MSESSRLYHYASVRLSEPESPYSWGGTIIGVDGQHAIVASCLPSSRIASDMPLEMRVPYSDSGKKFTTRLLGTTEFVPGVWLATYSADVGDHKVWPIEVGESAGDQVVMLLHDGSMPRAWLSRLKRHRTPTLLVHGTVRQHDYGAGLFAGGRLIGVAMPTKPATYAAATLLADIAPWHTETEQPVTEQPVTEQPIELPQQTERSTTKQPVSRDVFRLVTDDWHRYYASLLPPTEDPELLAIYAQQDRFIFYTHREIPRAYQHGDGANRGWHHVSHNFSAERGRSEPFGHANLEFPWAKPAGTDNSTNAGVFSFLLLPQDESGQTKPVVYWTNRYDKGYDVRTRGNGLVSTRHTDEYPTYEWAFPIGTVLGEVGLVHSPDGKAHAFQINVAVRERATWRVNNWRPFLSPSELAESVMELRPEWKTNARLSRFVAHCTNNQPLPIARLVDSQHNFERAFDQTFVVDELPDLGDNQLVGQLLKRPFRSTLHKKWREQGDYAAFAPTTKAAFSIVPDNFTGGAIETSQESCIRCHRDTHRLASEFQVFRDWYAHVGGGDMRMGIHFADPRCIAYDGDPPPARLREDFIRAGLLVPHNSAKHGNEYTKLWVKPQRKPYDPFYE